MSSHSTKPYEVPHYAYLVIRFYPANVPTHLAVMCHYGETNDIFVHSGLAKLSPRNNANIVHTFLLIHLTKLLGFYQPFNQFSKMHLQRETLYL